MMTRFLLLGLTALSIAKNIDLSLNRSSHPLSINQSELLNSSLIIPRTADRSTTQCGCGYSLSNPDPAAGRIVGGQEVNPPHSLPYQLHLTTRTSSCGATLLNKRYALTAMHCVQNEDGEMRDNIAVKIGAHSWTDGEKIEVDRVIARSDYTSFPSRNDIALLHLAQDVVFSSSIVPACLPTNPNLTYAGQKAIVSGWGRTSNNGELSDFLKSTELTIVAQDDPTCQVMMWMQTSDSKKVLPMDKMCAFGEGTDSCQGDIGGPLVVMEDGRYTVVGVVSYGGPCADPDMAGVYARVTTFLDWINTNIADGWC